MGKRIYSFLLCPLLFSTMVAADAKPESATRPLSGQDRAELAETLKVMEAVVRGTIPYEVRGESAAGGFSVDACRVPVPEILKVFLTGSTYTQNYKFEEDCDVEGTVVYSRQPFKVELKTRKTGKVNRIEGLVDYQIKPDLRTGSLHLRPVFKEGKVFIGSVVLAEFTADYKVTSDFTGKITANDGGVVKITSFRGTPITHAHPFKTDFVTN